jgi:hypothetical protein
MGVQEYISEIIQNTDSVVKYDTIERDGHRTKGTKQE